VSGGATLRIGTRGSVLARWQAERVRDALVERGHRAELEVIRTTGDVQSDVPLSRIADPALFTRQIDEALLAGRIDLAVHSLKDLPTILPDGIALAAVSAREDPRDALVGRGPLRWADLPAGATLATCSLRRRAQLLHARPDLTVVDLRGNVETRIHRLDRTPAWAGIILAVAALVRLDLTHRLGERLPPDLMLPAPGQGALAVTVRAGDAKVQAAAREAAHHPPTSRATTAERAFLRRLEGGCSVPAGALAEVRDDGRLTLAGRILALQGDGAVEGRITVADRSEDAAANAGTELADRLLSEGGEALLRAARSVA
jgi:hydroxymethylbilane synthase